MPEEPTENISGGDAGGGTAAEFDPDGRRRRTPRPSSTNWVEMYWQKAYGGQDAFECLVRTILSQNTSDAASQPAHDSLMERYDEKTGATWPRRSPTPNSPNSPRPSPLRACTTRSPR